MDCIDEYSHTSPHIMYFSQNIPTKEIEDTIQPSNIFCNCTELCTEDSSCSCILQSGSYYSYTDQKDLENYVLTLKNDDKPLYECNEQCTCKNWVCGNKLVQCGPRKGLKVAICTNKEKGEGVFTTNQVKSGNFICEYAGEIITENEASIRYKKNAKVGRMNYIFAINEHFGEKNIRTYIDPTFYGNIGRYLNHSCEPNCSMVVIRINDNIPILGLFACRDIEVGEELSYSYGSSLVENCYSTDNSVRCLCGAALCKKILPYDSRFN